MDMVREGGGGGNLQFCAVGICAARAHDESAARPVAALHALYFTLHVGANDSGLKTKGGGGCQQLKQR